MLILSIGGGVAGALAAPTQGSRGPSTAAEISAGIAARPAAPSEPLAPAQLCGSWTDVANYPSNIVGSAAVAQGGFLYNFGGYNGVYSNQAARYNGTTWTAIAPLPAERFQPFVVTDGTFIYIAGGSDGGGASPPTLWRYNPATNTYTTLAAMLSGQNFGAAAVLGGRIYVIAGCLTIANTCNVVNTVQVYDIAANTWSPGPAFPNADIGMRAVTLGGFLYVSPGQSNPTKTYRFDSTTWNDAAIADTPINKYVAAGGVLNGEFVLAGGDTGGASNTALSWNPATDTWTLMPNMNHVAWQTTGDTLGGAFYTVGGSLGIDYNGSPYTERFSPVTCPSATPTRTNTPTNTAVVPTVTPTNTPTNTAVVPTVTPTNTPTNTAVVPTNTPTRTPTTTAVVPTNTPTRTPTTTAVVPTNTPSNTPTNTAVVPTNTPTRTPTTTAVVPTNTPTRTPTGTFVVPTTTPTNTPTNTAVVPTTTPTNTPTNTPSETATITPTATPICTLPFTDVNVYNPFYVYIRCLYCRGIISGYADATFRPYNYVTRGQVAKMVSNAAGFSDAIPSDQQTFADVPANSPFWLYTERLAGRGIINGYTCGDPGEPCDGQNRPYYRFASSLSRGQLAKIAANAAGYSDVPPSGTQTFVDVPTDHPFWLFIERLSRRGIISGYECGAPGEPCTPPDRPYYRPATNITRAQTAKITANTFYPVNCAPGVRR